MNRLLFVVEEDGKKNWWKTDPSGDNALDQVTGRRYAEALTDYMAETGNTAALGWVLRQMVSNGRYGPVEVGFTQRIADLAAGVQLSTSVRAS